MDYHMLAEKLLDLQTILRLEPASRQLSLIERGSFLALHYLMDSSRTLHPKELSQKMAVSSARVAALLKHLEHDGLITRSPDPGDNRQVVVSLTCRGAQLIKEKRAEVVNIIAEALEELGPEEAETYLRIEEKFRQNFIRRTNCGKGEA